MSPSIGLQIFVGLPVIALIFRLLEQARPLARQRLLRRGWKEDIAWYVLGCWLGAGGLQRLVVERPTWLRAAALPLAASGLVGLTLAAVGRYAPELPLAGASSPEIASLAWRAPAGAAAMAGALGVIGLASAPVLARSRVLAMLGRQTMPIYLLHVLFLAGTRIVLVHAGLGDPGVLLPVLVGVGLAGPMLAAAAAARLGLTRLLGFG